MLKGYKENLTRQSIGITRFVKKQMYALNHKYCSLHDRGIFISFGNLIYITNIIVSISLES